jgi:two-component system NarL family sensor kinase
MEIPYQQVGGGQPLPSRVEVGLYRIAQEALANIIQHSGASRAEVCLENRPERVTLTIADNGRGLQGGQQPTGRFGLIGMAERARLLGGDLRIESGTDGGTRIVAAIPLP